MNMEMRRHKDRVLVSSYRARLNALEAAQQDGHGGHDLKRRLDEAEDLYRRCELPEPQVAEVDGQLVAELSGELSRCVRGVGAGVGAFQPGDFAARLVAAVGQSEALTPKAWTGLGQVTAPVLATCPGLRVLLGTLGTPNAPPPERKERKPRVKATPLGQAVKPDQVVEVAEPGATPQQINRLESTLKAIHEKVKKPISFFEFAYHPTDFGVTVENVFHTSILVKMGKARVFLRNGLPVIEPLLDAAGSGPSAASDDKHQVLVKIEPESWRRIVQEFGIKKALIPAADRGQRANGAK